MKVTMTQTQQPVIEGFRLSPQQKRLWLLQQAEPGLPSRAACAVLIEGNLDVEVFQAALARVVDRHEILRTTFRCLPGMTIPLQVIIDQGLSSVVETDVSGLSRGEQEARVEAHFNESIEAPMDFDHGPLLRVSLLKLSPVRRMLALSLPTLCADSATLGHLVRAIGQSYGACLYGEDLKDEPMQYADIAEWQNELLESDDTKRGREYWRGQDISSLGGLHLPFENPLHTEPGCPPASTSVEIPPEIARKIGALAQARHASISVFLLACWQVLLWRLTGVSDMIVGASCDGRNHSELKGALGLLTRHLPLQCRLDEKSRFIEVLAQIKTSSGAIGEWQEYFDLEQIGGSSQGAAAPTFFPFGFAFEEQAASYSIDGVSFSIHKQHACIDRFKIRLCCIRANDSLTAEFYYDSGIFSADDVQRLAGQFQTLLNSALAIPGAAIGELEILDECERHRVLVEWNDTQSESFSSGCVHELFAAQVERTPDALAAVFEDKQLTYRELNRRANHLAHHLQNSGVGPGAVVGLYLERSLDMVIGLLAALKAGGAYLPLDPLLPPERLAFMLQDAQVPVVVTQSHLAERLPGDGRRLVCLDTDSSDIAERSQENPTTQVNGANLAYVLFTSGSTGEPKAVAVEHRQLLNYIGGIRQRLDLPSGASFATVSTFAADLGNTVIFSALCSGGCLHVISHERASDPDALADYFDRHPIDCLKIVPSHLEALLASARPERVLPIRRLVLGGEACSWTLVNQVQTLAPDCVILNHYGPTETTVGVLTYRVDEKQADARSATVPIGRPIANTQVYLLDARGRPVPIGVPGELYIGGDSVARGYLKRPELTAEKFVSNPFSADSGARLYKTGDVARYLPNGDIEFVGRIDGQLKIRGFRVELGEIESVLSQHPSVQQVVVVARDDQPGDASASPSTGKRLIAYVVPHQGQTLAANVLRKFLVQKLPEYMVPSAFVFLGALPLTPNGKVDRKALPTPDTARPDLGEEVVAPRTPVEEALVGIWAEVLKLERVGIRDNFFDLGGHSLLATQLISRVRDAFKIELPLRSLFESPTVAGLAERIGSTRANGVRRVALPIRPEATDEDYPLSFAQERFWFLHQMEPNNLAYRISYGFRLTGPLNIEALEQSLAEMVRRHEVLRTTVHIRNEKPGQVIAERWSFRISFLDLSEKTIVDLDTEVQRRFEGERRRPFDLSIDLLFRATLLRLKPDEHFLFLNSHHIAWDHWCIELFFRELSILYRAFAAGQSSPLPQLPIQYKHYALWQRKVFQGGELERHLTYWRRQLNGAPSSLKLPADYPRKPLRNRRGGLESMLLPNSMTEELTILSRKAGVSLFMTFLAAFQTLLHRTTGQEDIVVGTPVAGRDRSETEGLIGLFLNSLALRTDLSGNPTFIELLRRVRDVTLGAYDHQDLSFEKLVEELQPERDLTQTPIFQVFINMYNFKEARLELDRVSVKPIRSSEQAPQFDIDFYIREHDDGIYLTFGYDADLFDAATIARMLNHYKALLQGIASDPEQRLSGLPMLTDAERHQLLVEWNDAAKDYPKDKCLNQLFEEQVERTPDAVAVVFEDQQLTYGELNARANQLAHYLRKYRVGPEALVGISAERSLELVVGLLGVLKAGGAYVPLDPMYPSERLAFMLQDAQVPVLLTQAQLVERQRQYEAQIVCLDADWDMIARESVENPAGGARPENLAYVIYTSGSTGKPKGVQITHDAVVNFLSSMRSRPGLTKDDVLLAVTTFSFDIAALEIFLPLIMGASVVMVSREVAADGAQLLQHITKAQATVMQATPATWRMLLSAGWRGSKQLKILCGGEALSRELTSQLLDRGSSLWNLYGPTESTIWSTQCRVESVDGTVPIGRPIANTKLYILDRHLAPAPIGVPGELYIGGDGLARGYLNRPELTAEKFIPNPFSTKPGARLYKTGDLARYRSDGNVEFLGRIDHQVKIRGFRIELGEIEAVLGKHPGVREAVVTTPPAPSGEGSLVAYVVPQLEASPGEAELAQKDRQAEQVAQWQAIFDDRVHAGGAAERDPTFNIAAWISSYTGEPIPAEEMREWLDDAVERVLVRRPGRVLEIGCGTGLVLFRVAPHCERYVGTDISEVGLEYIRQHLDVLGEHQSVVSLLRREADQFEGLEPGSFDAVVLNSVVQYFPDVEYLLRVLQGAAKMLAPGGVIILGDVRSLPLLQAFHTAVQLSKAEATLSVVELRGRVKTAVRRETELVIDPEFFIVLKEAIPEITRVEIEPKRGRALNEMTRFRYRVVVQIDGPACQSGEIQWSDWGEGRWSLEAIERVLAEQSRDKLGLRRVPNGRLVEELRALELLAQEGGPRKVGIVRAQLRTEPTGFRPDDLREIAARYGYTAILCWAHDREGRYDVVFQRGSDWPDLLNGARHRQPWRAYANNPMRNNLARELGGTLIPELRERVRQELPDYMVPSAFVVLEALPVGPNGKVDRRALPAPERIRPELGGTFVPPRSPIEETLAGIWAEVLTLGRVGVRDNFFELGGQSLLATQVMSRVRKAFGVDLPLRTLFEDPTIEEFSKVLMGYRAHGEEHERLNRVLSELEAMSDEEAKRLIAPEAPQ